MKTEEKDKSVGVVIVNWNGKELTKRAIESIEEHTEHPEYDVVVFDNNSSDGTVALLEEKHPEVTIIRHDSNIGFVGGENEGVLRTDHDYYFLANNDVVVHTDGWLKKMIETMESEADIGIVGPDNDPANVYHGGAHISPWNEGRPVEYREEKPRAKEADVVSGAQFLIDRAVFETIGLIDETFWPAYNEELDFCYRARRSGFKVVFEPRVLVEHLEGRTVDEDLDKFEIGRKHAIRYRWLNYPPSWLLLSLIAEPRYIIGCIFSGDWSLQNNWGARLKRQLRAYWWNIKNLPAILEGRRIRKKVLKTGDPHYEYWMKHRQEH